MANALTIVAIAKNEGRYLLEWIAYHLSIGVSKLVIYDNESTDGSSTLLKRLALLDKRVETQAWRTADLHASPQTTAYNDAIARVDTPWVMCLDIDEFVVPFADGDIEAFLDRVPADTASVHLNWKGFGSSGRTDPDYPLVTQAFTRAAHAGWGNNHHFKTMARTELVTQAFIHDIETSSGHRLLSDFAPFETVSRGLSSRIVHDGIQINHYQCKTLVEFIARMNRGDANYHPNHRLRQRDASETRFAHLDHNTEEDLRIAAFADRHMACYAALARRLDALHLAASPSAAMRLPRRPRGQP